MSLPSWTETLTTTWQRLARADRPPRVAVLGIGNALNGDDGAGPAVVEQLQAMLPPRPDLLLLDCGVAPENETGTLRRFAPDLVLLLDAAQMGAPPGTVCWIPREQIGGLSASTHSLPLSLLATYLQAELGCAVALLGIQPASNETGAALSAPVRAAVKTVAGVLAGLLRASQ
jgi:hydrogenase 3 maturation protease